MKKDPFEYKLRSLEEVIEYQKQNPPDFTFKLFFTFDQEKNEKGRDTGDHKVQPPFFLKTHCGTLTPRLKWKWTWIQ